MRYFLFFIGVLCLRTLHSQPTTGLVAYYPFDLSVNDATGNTANTGFISRPPEFGCGVFEEALSVRDRISLVRLVGPVREEFDTEDFTIAFYFRMASTDGIQYLLSKRRKDCLQDNSWYIRYRPSTRNINAVFSESDDKFINLVSELEPGSCWYHVAIVRDAGLIQLYINGKLIQQQGTLGRIDLRNDGDILIGGSECYGANETSFTGFLDELRIYNRALRREEVNSLLRSLPDRIVTQDTNIFLGNYLDLKLSPSCASTFRWSPAADLDDPNAPEPRFTPTQPGTYGLQIQMGDAASPCVATDSIYISVVDPNTLSCATVYLPGAFTPNGDGLNDLYGISNPYAIQQLHSFEIFDRWGARVFYTTQVFDQWDGSFQGQEVNPGVFIYRVSFTCNDKKQVQTGSFVVMK
jgi:gliding motility-associated-like protein